MNVIIKLKSLVMHLLIPICIGYLSSVLSGDIPRLYQSLILPGFAPPPSVFPWIWTILYLLMGISAYLIASSRADTGQKRQAMIPYYAGLFLNFLWSILFFRFHLCSAAFVNILAMIVLLILQLVEYRKLNRSAAALQLPYFLWLIFAGALNLSICLLN